MGMTFLADRCPSWTPRPQRRPGRTKAPQQFKVCAAPGIGRAPGARRLSKSGTDNDFYYPSHLKKCKAGLLPPAPPISLAPFPLSRPPRQPAPAELVDHHARQHGQRAHPLHQGGPLAEPLVEQTSFVVRRRIHWALNPLDSLLACPTQDCLEQRPAHFPVVHALVKSEKRGIVPGG